MSVLTKARVDKHEIWQIMLYFKEMYIIIMNS